MQLWEIDHQLMEVIDEETGEILDEAKFEQLEIERDKKIEGWLLYIKNLRAEAEAVKNEKLALAGRQQRLEKKEQTACDFITKYLAGAEFSTARVKVSYRKSEKLNVGEGAEVPAEFYEYEPKLKKADLKNAVKAGLEIDGVTIETTNNIQIK